MYLLIPYLFFYIKIWLKAIISTNTILNTGSAYDVDYCNPKDVSFDPIPVDNAMTDKESMLQAQYCSEWS